jgi:hypothetical protein
MPDATKFISILSPSKASLVIDVSLPSSASGKIEDAITEFSRAVEPRGSDRRPARF